MNKLAKHHLCSAFVSKKMLRCCMFSAYNCQVSVKTRQKDPQCFKKKKETCFYFSFFFTEKKGVDTEKYSHSWELRLITVDVRWALGKTVMGRKWVIIVFNQATVDRKDHWKVSSSWDTEMFKHTHTQPPCRSTVAAGGNNFPCITLALRNE